MSPAWATTTAATTKHPAAGSAQADAAADAASRPDLQGELQQTALAVHATVSALLRLACGELALSGALALRALLLSIIALACGLLAVAVGSALLVALGLSAGLGWPVSLGLCLLAILLASFVCLLQARRHLRGCGLSRTRAKLAALMPETSA